MSSTFFLQSVRMDVRIGSLVTPAAALNLFNVIIILLLIPFMDIIVYPCLARVGRKPTLLQRIGRQGYTKMYGDTSREVIWSFV